MKTAKLFLSPLCRAKSRRDDTLLTVCFSLRTFSLREILLPALMFIFCANMCAQVLIGGTDRPRNGAILDLNSTAKGGLILSNVTITDPEKIPFNSPNVFPGINASNDDINMALRGAMVYNSGLDPAVPAGIYIWNGYYWTQDGTCLPSILSTSPASVNTTAGKKATLSVIAACPGQYQWYSNNVPFNTGGTPISNSNAADCTTPDLSEGTYYYYCRVSSVSGEATSGVFTVTVGPNLSSLPAGTGSFFGRRCFDIVTGEANNDKNACTSHTVREKYKTDFNIRDRQDAAVPLPDGEYYSGVQIYRYIPYVEVTNVRFAYDELSGVSIDSIVPVGDYSGSYINTDTCKVAVYYRQSLNSELLNKTRDEGNKVKLYVIYNKNTVDYKLELTASLQDCACCEGAIVKGGAWDYADGNPGDWAAGKTVTSNTAVATPNPHNNLTNFTNLAAHFPANASGDLCWYKKNGTSTTSWAESVTKCASGEYADGDAESGWYLPNLKELMSLYDYLPADKVGTREDFGGSPDAQNMAGTYRSSTEYNATQIYKYRFGTVNYGFSFDNKVYNLSVRCVRRL